MAEAQNSRILLESGTNEIEIMKFTIGGNLFGINVAKVREIMISEPVKPMPHAHPAVEGIFKPRDAVLTVVDLPRYLGMEQEKSPKDIFIITNFNKMFIAFRVHTVVRIDRISWTDIQKPDKTVSGGAEGVATGIAQCEGGDLVTILDFERIVAEIAPETTIQISEVESLGPRDRNDKPIWVAEDSVLLSKMIGDSLRKANYVNLQMFPNGQELWDALSAIPDDRDLDRRVALIITDIEMPQMDGHRLTKLVKDSPRFKHIPLIIFSSLISEEMRIKGRQLGADEQLTKPEIGHLVDVMDHLLEKAADSQGK
ncbi:MAG: chemotaxis protein [Oscillospiraceae bacterium]|jgi:two-component system chemotaxis response regulator CheV|nr:chemotaxis protein CheV [Oscillospiraceae bacterium]MDE6899838.1 chemotaxis protein [Oscillospiraceae bacterium]